MSECELCGLERLTKWYYEDEDFIICDCLTCGVPMVVAREHTVEPEFLKGEGCEEILKEICESLVGRKVRFRKSQRKVKGHWHWHLGGGR